MFSTKPPNGMLAEGMVERSEIAGISAGYAVRDWEITDEAGKVLDPDVQQIRYDNSLTFTAARWTSLDEGSLVIVRAELSGIRSFGSRGSNLDVVRAHMRARQAISDPQFSAQRCTFNDPEHPPNRLRRLRFLDAANGGEGY